jgi:putative tryptophan/tyrosine transport system substrate-binding protein
MRRRELIAVLAAAIVAGQARGAGQAKPARVGAVDFGAPRSETIDGLRRGLADKGYIEGKNLVLEARFAEGRSDRLPALVAEVLALGIDVLFAPGTQTALVAKRQTTTVPIVFQSGDPVGAGLVANLARPGGNLTGVSLLSGEYSTKWLELLKEAVPTLRRIAVLWNPNNPVIAAEVERMQLAAPGQGLELATFPMRAKDVDTSLAAIASAGVDGLVITDDSFLDSLAPRIAAFATEHRLPAIAGFRSHVREGLLMSYSVDFLAITRRAASYIDRILKGALPADLPVEQATEFALRINLQTANALGLTIPPSLLARADEVIE